MIRPALIALLGLLAVQAVATFLAVLPPSAIAQSSSGGEVIAVVAIDSYGELKQHLDWLGHHIDQAGLAGIVESGILLATKGKGLTGLDENRPIGVVVTASDGVIGIHAIVPVTDLDKLLAEFQGATGPVETDGDFRRFKLPSGEEIEVSGRDGWAVIGEPGKALGIADPACLIDSLAEDSTIAVEIHPSALPESLRSKLVVRFEASLAAGWARRAADGDPTFQGPPLYAQALFTALDNLSVVETLSFGIAVDPQDNSLILENKVILVKGPRASNSTSGLTVATAATRDGGRPAIKIHAVQPLSDSQERQLPAILEGILPHGQGERSRIVSAVVRSVVEVIAEAGGLDAALTVDTSVAGELPMITVGAHVADGPKLERLVKELFQSNSKLPKEVKAKFDTGKVGKANLHTVTIDVSATPVAGIVGPAVELTLAVTPDYAFILHGGDVLARLGELLVTNGQANRSVSDEEVPGLAIELALDQILAYAASMGFGQQAEVAAEKAASRTDSDEDSGSIHLSTKPIDGGIVTRLTVGTGAFEAVAAMTKLEPWIGSLLARPEQRLPADREPAGAR
ncbi:MAG: hypothetical protein EXS06_11070 [Planctomycetaceae bacterium]|nr:hypothetical protein [Planctomycetaceae bacterium]